MKAIWDHKGEPELKDVIARIEDYGKKWKPQTVSTFLAKIRDKDFIAMHREGKIYHYEVLVAERDYQRQRLKHLAELIYNGNIEQLIADAQEEKA